METHLKENRSAERVELVRQVDSVRWCLTVLLSVSRTTMLFPLSTDSEEATLTMVCYAMQNTDVGYMAVLCDAWH